MKYELIQKHFGDREEYHVCLIKDKVVTAARIFHNKEDALKYLDEMNESI